MNKEKDRNICFLGTAQETQNKAFNGQCTFAENFDAHHPKKIIQPLISSQRITTFAEITAEKCDFLHFSALKSVISPNYKPNQRHAHWKNTQIHKSLFMEDYNKYQGNYSEGGLWNTVKKWTSKLGEEAIYNICLLYYLAKSPDLPATDKMKVLGVLGYLILPADVLPDITPIVGFSDDLAAIVFLLKNLSKYTTSEIKEKARERAKKLLR